MNAEITEAHRSCKPQLQSIQTPPPPSGPQVVKPRPSRSPIALPAQTPSASPSQPYTLPPLPAMNSHPRKPTVHSSNQNTTATILKVRIHAPLCPPRGLHHLMTKSPPYLSPNPLFPPTPPPVTSPDHAHLTHPPPAPPPFLPATSHFPHPRLRTHPPPQSQRKTIHASRSIPTTKFTSTPLHNPRIEKPHPVDVLHTRSLVRGRRSRALGLFGCGWSKVLVLGRPGWSCMWRRL